MTLARAVLDLLFPPTCKVCRAPGPDALCSRCLSDFRLISPPVCRKCGRPRRGPVAPELTCFSCRHRSLHFSVARAAGIYEGGLREAVHALKFDRCRALAKPLARVMLTTWAAAMTDIDVVVPVPLHTVRLRERGFNQSELLAGELGRALRKPLVSGLLVRTRQTEAQSNLDVRQRRENVRGAFELRDTAEARRVLLVDDVISTGYTTSECARVLRCGGAGRIVVIAAAMALRDR